MKYKPTGQQVDRYTRGQCHALALALHRMFGLRLVGQNWYDKDEDSMQHVTVRLSRHMALDVNGRAKLNMNARDDEQIHWYETDEKRVRYHVKHGGYEKPIIDEETKALALKIGSAFIPDWQKRLATNIKV